MIVLGDVIEHLVDPLAALEHIATLLAPGGVLYMTLPDSGSWIARRLGARWWSVLPTHLQYFTRDSLRVLLERAGYETLEITTAPKTFTIRYYFSRLSGYSPLLARVMTRFFKLDRLRRRPVDADFYDRMAVIAASWVTCAAVELESEVQRVGRELAAALPSAARHPLKAVDDRAMELASSDAELKAALFRFVDVVPACRNLDDLARHLSGFLREVEEPPPPIALAMGLCTFKGRPRRARLGRRGRRQAHGAPLHRRRVPGRRDGRAARACGRTASPPRSTCSARRPSPPPRPTATPRAARRRSPC